MSIIGFLFSFQGRINRLHYWMSGFLIIIFVASILAVGASTLPSDLSGTQSAFVVLEKATPFLIALGLSFVLCLWVSLAIAAKRIHDLGHSAVLLIPLYLSPVFLGLFGIAGSVLGILISLGTGIWFAFFPGVPSENDFGPNPNGTAFGSLPGGHIQDSTAARDPGAWAQNAQKAMDEASARARGAAKARAGQNDLTPSPIAARRQQAAPAGAPAGFGRRSR